MRWWFAGGVLGAGALVGLTVGAVADLLSVLPFGLRALVAVVAVVAALGLELTGKGGTLPQNRRLVPSTITSYHPWRGALQFGFEMGTGMRTFMPSATPHALVLVLLATGGSGVGILAGVAFGLGRLAMPLSREASLTVGAWDDLAISKGRTVTLWMITTFTLIVIVMLLQARGV